MKKIVALLMVLAVGAALMSCASKNTAVAGEALPAWVTRAEEAWVEGGAIYARGTARMSSVATSTSTAESRARNTLARALIDGELTAYPAIPTDVNARTTFNYNNKSVVVGDLTVKETFAAADGNVHVLLSCTGAEGE
jgi:hypothetical protein